MTTSRWLNLDPHSGLLETLAHFLVGVMSEADNPPQALVKTPATLVMLLDGLRMRIVVVDLSEFGIILDMSEGMIIQIHFFHPNGGPRLGDAYSTYS